MRQKDGSAVMLTRFIIRRLLILVVQAWVMASLVFVLVQLLPGDPLYALVSETAGEQAIQETREFLGLDRPLYERYFEYVQNLAHGDLGTAFFNSRPVADELIRRFPATLELVLFTLLIALPLGSALGCIAAFKPSGLVERATFFYGMLAGALPEFWWGLVLILVMFNYFGVVAAPIGRLDLAIAPPERLTGLYTVDSLVTGNWPALASSLRHLLLPTVTLIFIQAAGTLKMTRFQVATTLNSEYVRFARACGLPERKVIRYALRNALPPVVSQWALDWSYLVGGVVLIETLFSWGGMGHYLVQAAAAADFVSVTGGVLALTLWTLLVFLILDIALMFIDPRLRMKS
jgi:ABC-type dipeptide/oligopeptide/nickel transport system permease component